MAQEGLGGLGGPGSRWWEQYLGDVVCQGTVEVAHRVGMQLLGPPNQLGQVGHRIIPYICACLEEANVAKSGW